MIKRIHSCVLVLTLTMFSNLFAAQDTIRLEVRANVSKNGVVRLRWAAATAAGWRFVNTHGVAVERYTLARGGTLLDVPQKTVLTTTVLKPPVLNAWKEIALADNKAAIIAQALYGKDFNVTGGRAGIGQIIALSQEQQQRFAMSLYAADQSYRAALFAGWGFEDRTAKRGEKYLYRIIPAGKIKSGFIEIGSAIASPDDYQELPRPLELTVFFGNGTALVAWNYALLERTYNAYHLERSEDGKAFRRLDKNPLVNVTGGSRMFYTDSVANGRTYYYRVAGITPFGDEGPVSDTVQGVGSNKLIYTPHILRAIPQADGSAQVEWEFDEKGNADIIGFELQRSDTGNEPFEPVAKNIAPPLRKTTYARPLSENYFRIAAIPKEGEPICSQAFFMQVADSVPPAEPTGLQGQVDSAGVVRLSWRPNTEDDILGYRILRGQTATDDLVPLNKTIWAATAYTDTISLKNLNDKTYYAVIAIDRRQNQSKACPPIVLDKPLQVKPAPPLITRCEADGQSVVLEWVTGDDPTLTAFSVWRRAEGDNGMKLLKIISNPQQKSLMDNTVADGIGYAYEVVAVNRANLESDPSPVLRVKIKAAETSGIIKAFSAGRTQNGILLKWQLGSHDVQSVTIYRKEAGDMFRELKVAGTFDDNALDATAARNTALEYMLVVKNRTGKVAQKQIKVD